MTHEQRLDRLEVVVHVLAEDQLALQKLIAEFATETRQGFERVARQFEETDRRILEMNRQTDDRVRHTDERIANLVSAIGQMIRQDRSSGS